MSAVAIVVVEGWAGQPRPIPITVNGVLVELPLGEQVSVDTGQFEILQNSVGVRWSVIRMIEQPAPAGDPALVAVLAGTVQHVIAALDPLTIPVTPWTDEQLAELLALEAAGKNRKAALSTINEAIAAKAAPAEPGE